MIILNYYGVPFLLRGLAKPGRAIRYIFLKGTSRPQFPFKKDVAAIPNAGLPSITISKFKIDNSTFNIHSSSFTLIS